jgi:hypothetical protein
LALAEEKWAAACHFTLLFRGTSIDIAGKRGATTSMRKYLASILFAGWALAASPLAAAPAANEATEATPAVAVQQVRVPVPGLRDEMAMVLVGTALIGLAAAVRRAA